MQKEGKEDNIDRYFQTNKQQKLFKFWRKNPHSSKTKPAKQ